MVRPKRATVEYFSHDCTHGKTMFIIEQKWGNDGYTFWFKLLELLGTTEGHVLPCNNPAQWAFLQAKTRLSEETTEEILNMLASLDAIDQHLWQKSRVIWCQNFVNRLASVYSNRRVEIPLRPSFYTQESQPADVSTGQNPQSKVNESKVNEKKSIAHRKAVKPSNGLFDTFWSAYPKKKSKGTAEKVFAKIRPNEQLLATMLATIERAKASEDWSKESGKYIPHPATWLNGRRWEDEIGPPASRFGQLPTHYTDPEDYRRMLSERRGGDTDEAFGDTGDQASL